LLLGVGLLLRDLHFTCFVDHNEIEVPSYVMESCMDAGDVGSITKVLENISNALQDELRYVHLYHWAVKVLTRV
jgi:hypothetical protein